MLGGNILAAPPEHAHAAAGVVEPRLPYRLRRKRFGHGVVRKRAHKDERTVHIVVRGIIPLLAQIAEDVAGLALQPFIRAAAVFNRSAGTNSGDHADVPCTEFFESFSFHSSP